MLNHGSDDPAEVNTKGSLAWSQDIWVAVPQQIDWTHMREEDAQITVPYFACFLRR